MLGELGDTGFRRFHAATAFEAERLGHHTHGQYTHFTSHFGHHRRRTGTGATTHAGGNEGHVRTFKLRTNLFPVRFRSRLAGFRLGAGTEAALAQRQLGGCCIACQRLGIGVGSDELNAAHAFADHVLDGIATGTTYAEHLDDGALRLVFVDDFKHKDLLRKKPLTIKNSWKTTVSCWKTRR